MTTNGSTREVNNILNTLRGEHFRHQQNLRQSRSHLYSSSRSINLRTLPTGLLESQNVNTPPIEPPKLANGDGSAPRRCSGPAPPKSWRLIKQRKEDTMDSPSWRAQVLELAARRIPDLSTLVLPPHAVPPLTTLCLTMILCGNKLSSDELRKHVLQYIPSHLRSHIVRSCAVHTPFPRWKLDLLYEPDGHAEGEIIVVGPKASLRDDESLRNGLRESTGHSTDNSLSATQANLIAGESDNAEEDDWEADEALTRSLETAIFLSVRMSTFTMLTFPPTLKNLVLVHLAFPLPLHRLPKQCPLLEFLDLSDNVWLQNPSQEVVKSVERIEWGRWVELKVLGWRRCSIVQGMVEKLNKGRWSDVEFVVA